MLLENKNAVIYGAAGAVGSAVAQAFAREGARLFLTGRDLGALDALAKEITSRTSSTKPPPSISRSTPSGFRSKGCKAFP